MNAQSKPVGYWFEEMSFSRAHLIAGLVLFFSFVIESWEMMIIIYVGSSIGSEFNLNTQQLGQLIGAMFIGMIPGALLWGKLIDILGRKKSLVASLAFYCPLPILCMYATSFETLWWLRLVGGIILSGTLVVTFPYFEELVPVKSRGPATVFLSAGWPVGILIAIGVTALLGEHGWRWVIGISAFTGIWAIVVACSLPESPYWLAGKGRVTEAEDGINRLSGGSIKAQIETPQSSIEHSNAASYLDVFKGDLTKLTILQLVLNFCFAWGYWGLTSWMPALLMQRGLSAPQGLSFMALSALFMFPGYIAASFFTGRYGRKKVMTGFVFAATVAGFGFAYSSSINSMYAWNFALSFFSLGAWGVWNTWMAEIYSTQMRSAGFSLGISAQRIANAIAPIAIGAVLLSATFLETVLFISAFLAVTFVCALFLPETEGTTLS